MTIRNDKIARAGLVTGTLIIGALGAATAAHASYLGRAADLRAGLVQMNRGEILLKDAEKKPEGECKCEDKSGEGKCGEGKCAAGGEKAADCKCPEQDAAKTDAAAAAEAKDAEGKCGEGKCG